MIDLINGSIYLRVCPLLLFSDFVPHSKAKLERARTRPLALKVRELW